MTQRNKCIVVMIDIAICTLKLLRREYLSEQRIVLDFLCGDWARKDSKQSYRIYRSDRKFFIEERTGNPVDDHVEVTKSRLRQRKDGTLFYGASYYPRPLGFHAGEDLIQTEIWGMFKRVKE